MVRNQISRFEALARRIVEGSIGRLIGDDSLALQIAAQLTKLLEENQGTGRQPLAFHILVNPADLRTIGAKAEELEVRLARHVSSVTQTGLLGRRKRSIVRLIPDLLVPQGQVTIEVSDEERPGETTSVLNPSVGQAVKDLRKLDAFLIVNGRRHVALDKPLTRIGRRTDNDVIIDSPIVSRQHAHIRWRQGRFILFDVGSRGGVQLNGERISEAVLAPGDLITLSDRVPLIYGEGLEGRDALLPKDDKAGSQDTLTYSPDND